MNKQGRKRLEKSYGLIDEAMEEEQEAYDNLPENFQNGERGEEMTGYIGMLEEAGGYLDETKSVMAET